MVHLNVLCYKILDNVVILGEPPPSDLPPGLQPTHKAAIVLFLERVYSIPDQMSFFRLLENGFLPDLRAATTLDTVGFI